MNIGKSLFWRGVQGLVDGGHVVDFAHRNGRSGKHSLKKAVFSSHGKQVAVGVLRVPERLWLVLADCG